MLLWSSKSNNASSSVCSCHIQGTSHERRRGKTFSDVSQWLRTPQRFGECTNTSMAQGLRGTGLKKPSRPIIVTAQMRRKWLLAMSTVIIKGHNEMRLSIKERMLWVKRKKEYESRLWRMTLKNQIWLTCKLPMNHHTTHSPGLSVWRSELSDLPCSRLSQMTFVCSALSTVLLFGQRHSFPGDFTGQWGTWLIPVQSTELH